MDRGDTKDEFFLMKYVLESVYLLMSHCCKSQDIATLLHYNPCNRSLQLLFQTDLIRYCFLRRRNDVVETLSSYCSIIESLDSLKPELSRHPPIDCRSSTVLQYVGPVLYRLSSEAEEGMAET